MLTISTLAEGTLLADPQELAAKHPRVPLEDLQKAVSRASGRFEGAIGYPFAFISDDVIVLCGDGSKRLLLPGIPVIGDPVVTIDGEPVAVRVNRAAGILRRADGQAWPNDFDNVKVTYSHGHTMIPRGVQDAILEQAEALLVSTPGVAARQAGSESITFLSSATVGVTQRWVDTVRTYEREGDA